MQPGQPRCRRGLSLRGTSRRMLKRLSQAPPRYLSHILKSLPHRPRRRRKRRPCSLRPMNRRPSNAGAVHDTGEDREREEIQFTQKLRRSAGKEAEVYRRAEWRLGSARTRDRCAQEQPGRRLRPRFRLSNRAPAVAEGAERRVRILVIRWPGSSPIPFGTRTTGRQVPRLRIKPPAKSASPRAYSTKELITCHFRPAGSLIRRAMKIRKLTAIFLLLADLFCYRRSCRREVAAGVDV